MTALTISQRNGLLGPDFKLAMMVLFGSGRAISASDFLQMLEDSRANFIDGFSPIDDTARGQVDVAAHSLKHAGI